MEEKIVSVLLLAENNEDNEIFTVVRNIFDQTYKNIDLIVSTFRPVTDEFKDKVSKFSMNVRWVEQDPSPTFITELIGQAHGEYIFYKTLNNVLWYPRHIEVHIDQFVNDKKAKWALSHIEYRNIELGDHPFNALSFRIDNPPHPDKVMLDEIVHATNIQTDWSQCLREENGNQVFFAGYVTKQWIDAGHRGCIPPELTVIAWVLPNNKPADESLEELYKQVGVPAQTDMKEETKFIDGEIVIERSIPTVMGNNYHKEYNDGVKQAIASTVDITSIGIKRCIGMGDVVVVEPIIKKLKQKYPQAAITLYTASPKIVQYFAVPPDHVVEISQDELLKDFLSTTDNQVKFDLDLAYESRTGSTFIDAYADVCGIEFDEYEEKHCKLIMPDEPIVEGKYVVVCGDGSGWPGKQWPLEKWTKVIKYLQSKYINVIETGMYHTELTDSKWHGCDFPTMMNLIAHADLYMGGDNGPMHIARGYNVPCLTIAGAALPFLTNPNRDKIYYLENATSPGYGIKHKFFFDRNNNGITFVPQCEDDPSCGLDQIEHTHVIEAFEKVMHPHFDFNVNGALVIHDVIVGSDYYKKGKGLYVRGDLNYHPDQRINISQYYAKDPDGYFDKYLKPIYDRINKEGTVLDVGCNMGILLDRLDREGVDCSGVDINIGSIKTGLEKYPHLQGKIAVKNFAEQDLKLTMKYDTIVLGDIVDKISNFHWFWENVDRHLTDDGEIIITNACLAESFKVNKQKWPRLGFGENLRLFDIFELKGFVTGHMAVDVIEEEKIEDDVWMIVCRRSNHE